MKSIEDAIKDYEKRKSFHCNECKKNIIETTTCCGTLDEHNKFVEWCLVCCPLKDNPIFADLHK